MKRILSLLTVVAVVAACSGKGYKAPSVSDDWTEDAVIYELNVRQATAEGTLAAAEAKLSELKEVGVDVVWIMPLYPIGVEGRKGTLGSYYAIKDYCDVNPEFGTLADFDHFLGQAHDLGLKVIIDWVANHTSPDHPWVTEKDPSWYVRDEEGKTIVEYDWTDIAKLNFENKDMRAAMEKCMRFWLDRGIDGFRCDVAYQVPQDFWTDVFTKFRNEYPRRLFFLAEGEETWLKDAGFDCTYAWRLHHLLNDIAQGKANVDSLLKNIKWNEEGYGASHRLMFTSNHDENAWSGTEFERMGDAWKAMTVLCWTLPGSQPLMYTAQEVGYNHRFEFFEKDPMPDWHHNAVTDFYSYLNALKHSHPALDSGNPSFEVVSKTDTSLCFKRVSGDDAVTVSVLLKDPWTWSVDTPESRISKVEPPCWWTGMKTELQLMIHGDDIASWDVAIEGSGLSIAGVHKADSPNYLFVDVKMGAGAKPGTYNLVFKKGKESFNYPYEILAREEGSADRKSFTTSDFIYLINPDRFANADPGNDNTDDTFETADRSRPFGRHGGDLQGIIDHLDYIADLGATAIWCTPLLMDNQHRESYHGYACGDYYRIDPRFGSNAQYKEYVAKAHEKGLKVIMDIVTNHCGTDHWWMNDLPFKDWIHQFPEYTQTNYTFPAVMDPNGSKYDLDILESGWFVRSMPDMNLDNPFLLKYFQQWAIWWTEYSGQDGLRVDTYPYNEKVPMSKWCEAVINEYPNLNIVGECWDSNFDQLAYWQGGNVNQDGFDSHLPSIMDFPLQEAINAALAENNPGWGQGMYRIYHALAHDATYHDLSKMMIFLSNHDHYRIADSWHQDPDKMKIAYTLLATIRGIPQLFYGDEMMFATGKDYKSDGELRMDFPGGWEGDATNLFTEEGRTGVEAELHDYARTLFQWRKGKDVIHNGRTVHFMTRDNTYAFFRYNDTDKVFVFVNNSPEEKTIPWSHYAEITSGLGEGTNVVTGEKVTISDSTVVPASTALVIEY
jgi:glycosidase